MTSSLKSKKMADCIRTVGNWSHVQKNYLIDNPAFDVKHVKKALPEASPKLQKLIDTIHELDAQDQKKHGKLFKHMIFTDIHNSQYGSKIIGAALVASGFHHVYDKSFKVDETKLIGNEKSKTKYKGKNFALITSTAIFKSSLKVKLRRKLLDIFNQRPDNVQGDLLRIVVLDRGFREGIDLFDVKYVHLVEPLISHSDERQAVGRATRFCGQKGLRFDPQQGWQLHVYRYDTNLPDSDTTVHEEFMTYSGLDLRQVVFANKLQDVCKEAAVDAELTANVHEFDITKESDSKPKSSTKPVSVNDINIEITDPFADMKDKPQVLSKKAKTMGGAKNRKEKGQFQLHPKPPTTKKNFSQMRRFISQRFSKYTWPRAILENQCIPRSESSQGGAAHAATFMNFTPSQDFVRNYFDPRSAYKGILVWHSLGSGKTCTAIATATTGWESRGYTILWVTRHTLKPDIYKNMFDTICSISMQTKIRDGLQLPVDARKQPRKYLSKNWILPMSYKQFSNALAGKNALHKDLVARNGTEDLLHKTLIVIDEAHKLFAPDMVGTEKPDTALILRKIKESYEKSKDDSARLFLMTGTPYTNDPMHLIRMLNIMRDPAQDTMFPEDFDAFQEMYLNEKGEFTTSGKTAFQNEVAGYISYLNREKDARQFAYPVYHVRHVPISESKLFKKEAEIEEIKEYVEDLKGKLKEGKTATKAAKQKMKGEQKEMVAACEEKHKVVKERKACVDNAKKQAKKFEEQLLSDFEQRMARDDDLLKVAKQDLRDAKKEYTVAKKADVSQEAQLVNRCGWKKLQ